MAAAAQEESDDQITGINVTPLVDIVLVLLIIFMVTASLVQHETIEVDVPSPAKGPADVVKPPVMVSLDARGLVFVDGVELAPEAALAKLREVVAADADVKAVIAAAPALDYGKVVETVDLVKAAGVKKFALNMQKAAP